MTNTGHGNIVILRQHWVQRQRDGRGRYGCHNVSGTIQFKYRQMTIHPRSVPNNQQVGPLANRAPYRPRRSDLFKIIRNSRRLGLACFNDASLLRKDGDEAKQRRQRQTYSYDPDQSHVCLVNGGREGVGRDLNPKSLNRHFPFTT